MSKKQKRKIDGLLLAKSFGIDSEIVVNLNIDDLLGNVEGLDPITAYIWTRKFNEEEFDNYRKDYSKRRSENAHRLHGSSENIGRVVMGLILDSFRERYHIEKGKDELEERTYLKLLQMHHDNVRKNKPWRLADIPLGVHYFLMRMAYFDHFPPEYQQRKTARDHKYFMQGVPSLKDSRKDDKE